MKKLLIISIFLLFPKFVFAHCPLCTVGAGLLAVLAAYLGISSVVVGMLIGAFALALSLWLAKLPKKQYIPHQKLILGVIVFLGTIIPIMPLIQDYGPLYVSFGGAYGTLLHNTYTINLFLAGIPLGVCIVWIAPHISKWFTKVRKGEILPFQGLTITLLLLIVLSVIIQVLS